jgi:uncharacterized protein
MTLSISSQGGLARDYASCAYTGVVVHKRLAPKRHAFKYSVFSLCLDVDEIDRLTQSLRLFSRNRWNVLGFYDRDHGNGGGKTVAAHMRELLAEAGMADAGVRIELLCYPRLFGFVFNPLSVYFCYGRDDKISAIVYEVTNTFRERRCYVIPVTDTGASSLTHAQHCAKQLYVSPFTGAEGSYDFHIVAPAERVVVGVAFREAGVPVLKTHFSGVRRKLSDVRIAALVARYPLMTLKVVAGIHIEAARLWFKGVPLVARHGSAPFSFTVVKPPPRDATYV